ncbi:MAG TPA: carotenoid biosynthesis protein [Flavobacteriales bacterium]|nr:carotenoid biosynthesis protein [Flavobacteriales bacterium]
MKPVLYYTAIAVLIVMHAVGLYGLTHNHMTYYRDLTAFNLTLTFVLFLVGAFRFDLPYLITILVISAIGLVVEIIGVKTKLIFGDYNYTTILGPDVIDVPLVIGLNWGLLIMSCAAIVYNVYNNNLARAMAGATLMLLMDIVLEPIAFKYNFWQWDTKTIPLQNYIAWWLVSFTMLLGVFSFLKNPHNKMAYWVFGVQFLFFCLLNLLT